MYSNRPGRAPSGSQGTGQSRIARPPAAKMLKTAILAALALLFALAASTLTSNRAYASMQDEIAASQDALEAAALAALGETAELLGSGASIPDAIDVSFGSSYSIVWTNNNCKTTTYYKLATPASGFTTIAIGKPLDANGNTKTLNIAIYDSNGTPLWSSNQYGMTDSKDSSYRYAVGLAAGTYYFSLQPAFSVYSNATLSTQIAFGFVGEKPGLAAENENNNTQESANALSMGRLTMGYLGSGGRTITDYDHEDWYSIPLVAGVTYTLAVDFSELGETTPLMSIVQPDGTELIYDANKKHVGDIKYAMKRRADGEVDGISYISFVPTQTGTHYLRAYNYSGKPLAYCAGFFEGGIGDVSDYSQSYDPATNNDGGLVDKVPSQAISGQSRYETAAKIATTAYPNGSDGVVVATGEAFPDALSASALAGMLGYPVVLTATGTLSTEAESAIKNTLHPKEIIIVSGTAAVSQNVETALSAYGTVTRVAGNDRYDTARAIYTQGSSRGTWGTTAIITTGKNYPDALSISGFAFAQKAPIFLVDPVSGLDQSTQSYLENGGFQKILILGGSNSVPSSAESWASAAGIAAQRISGNDRYQTSQQIGEYVVANGGTADNACIATGANFPDALAGSALAGVKGSVVLLAVEGFTDAFSVLSAHKDQVKNLYFLGGTTSLPNSVRNAALNAAS